MGAAFIYNRLIRAPVAVEILGDHQKSVSHFRDTSRRHACPLRLCSAAPELCCSRVPVSPRKLFQSPFLHILVGRSNLIFSSSPLMNVRVRKWRTKVDLNMNLAEHHICDPFCPPNTSADGQSFRARSD
ncbi:Hypothetical predicted protein [Xyrichtys novacula]|uniref:Uncharacterized protein n=1 Tax=Xyrichtys novacula TaxID=13765 RepID=A0AAV1GHV8_XYRNO|nr:Hypothetical predicted protein [Xyrichtys novacula]